MGLPNLSALKKKCEELGLTVVQKGKRPAKDDYVVVLRDHFMPAGGLKYTELEPMLAFPIWNLSEEEAESIWGSKRWVAQKKLNGCRVILHFIAGVGVFAHSRTVSLKTYRMQELTNQLLFHDYVPSFSATLDCEAIIEKSVDTRPYTPKGEVTQTSLHSTTCALHLEAENSRRLQKEQDAPIVMQTFDIVNWKCLDLRNTRLEDRLIFLMEFEEEIKGTELAPFFEFPLVVYDNKKAFFEELVATGSEGVILKNLNAGYEDSSSRRRDGWVKVKKRMEFDAFVTGFKRGEAGSGWENLVGALEFSVMTENGPHPIGFASNFTMETRQKISSYDPVNNSVALDPRVYGKVAEISGQDISAREMRLSHCTIDRWRPKQGPDAKLAEDCKASLADLKEASRWVG